MVVEPLNPDTVAFGSVVDASGRRFAAARAGEHVLDLGLLDAGLFAGGTLDAFLAAGRAVWRQVRADVAEALAGERHPLVPLADVRTVLGFTVADYVDFYASRHHATNAGRILRPGGEALPRNWTHLPIGYHGRSGSVVVSGTDVVRPRGIVAAGEYAPTARLDFEAELAFVVGVPGTRIPVGAAEEHVFGVALLNDWSARDVQAFEAQPLGPMLGKSFATSIAGWITPLDALRDARVDAVQGDVPTHLAGAQHGLRIALEVRVNDTVVSRPDFTDMYWTYAQMLAHLTSNGSAVRTGDVFASGTVSGPEPGQRGCLLELTWNGTQPLRLDDGTERAWLADGDTVSITARAGMVTLGDVVGRIRPSAPESERMEP